PGTKKRRYFDTPADQVHHEERPDLRIIDQETWDKAQSRIEKVAGKYGKNSKGRAPTRKTNYVLSGLLYCGHCENNMSIIGGSTCRYYRCTAAHKMQTCPVTQPLR